MVPTRSQLFKRRLQFLITAGTLVFIPALVSSRHFSETIFTETFESGALNPAATIQSVGDFIEPPGIKDTGFFGSSKAFGFGKSTCNSGCWYGNTCTLRINLPEPCFIAVISFREAELGGNYGSTGYVKVDGQVVEDGEFQRLPWNDLTADAAFRTHGLLANRYGQTVELTVIDITGSSEMFIDDIAISVYKDYYASSLFTVDFSQGGWDPSLSVQKTGSYTMVPGFRSTSLFSSGQAWGFGRSTSTSGAYYDYMTDLTLTLPDLHYIKGIRFVEAEQDTNWGNQGKVLVDDQEVPGSHFGRMPSNDLGVDTGFRTHYIPVYRMGNRVTLRAWDITKTSELLITNLSVLCGEPEGGELIVLADFEDGNLPIGATIVKRGEFGTDPAVHATDLLGGQKAFGFGKSVCTAYCYEDYQSSLVIVPPENMTFGSLSFKAMESDGNFGSQGRLIVNGEIWPGIDFSRYAINDLTADMSYRSYQFIFGDTPAHRIEWNVWDITNSSQVFIDDIALYRGAVDAVRGGSLQPEGFEVRQNYPNPFNASTVIGYMLPEPTPVVVDIFNSQGERVDRMDLGKQAPGEHEAVWDGSRFSSGTYFCSVQTPRFVKVMKISLIR
jgi:hypothetical protein